MVPNGSRVMPLSIRYASLALRTLSLLDLMILVDCKTVLRHALPISLLILRKKTDCFAVYDFNGISVMSLAE